MADENKSIDLINNKSFNRDEGVLYFYELDNKKIYIGRYQKTDKTSRARDHFYNAIVYGFPKQKFDHYYHSQGQDDSITKFSKTSPSRLEREWGQIIKKAQPGSKKKTFYTFLQIFLNLEDLKKIQEDVQAKKIIIQKKHYREIKEIDQKEQTFTNLVYKDDKFELNELKPTITDQQKMIASDFENIFKGKIKEPNIKNLGIDYYSVKFFVVDDPYWYINFNSENLKERNFNVIQLINNLEPPNNLRNVNLGEFLLTMLSIASQSKITKSLNDKIGDFSNIYKYYKKNYKPQKRNFNINMLEDQFFSLIKSMNKTNIEYRKNKKPIENNKLDANDKPISITIDNDFQLIMNKWISNHLGIAKVKEYWTEDNTISMLKDNFKYSLKIWTPQIDIQEIVSDKETEYIQDTIKEFHQ